jgi:hypothetical protein
MSENNHRPSDVMHCYLESQAQLGYLEQQPKVRDEAVRHCMRICGFSDKEIKSIWRVRMFDDMDDFTNKNHKDFHDLSEQIMKHKGGGWLIGEERIQNLLAVVDWATDMRLLGGIASIDGRYFTKATLEEKRRKFDEAKGPPPKFGTKLSPPKLDVEEWMYWEQMFYSYLAGVKNIIGWPLCWMLDPILDGSGDTLICRFEYCRKNPRKWPEELYKEDNEKLHAILEYAVAGTPGQYKIGEDDKKDGFDSYKKLRGWGRPSEKKRDATFLARCGEYTNYYETNIKKMR